MLHAFPTPPAYSSTAIRGIPRRVVTYWRDERGSLAVLDFVRSTHVRENGSIGGGKPGQRGGSGGGGEGDGEEQAE